MTVSDFEDLLRIYYKRLFPYEPYCRWIGSNPDGDKTYLSRREFSFTLQDDIYLRYMTFNNADELKAEMLKRLPIKMDIGAVYNAKAADHTRTQNFQAMEKDLVFDIDMTDYDPVRYCCEGAAICAKCWKFMILAVKILDAALRDDFGFEHILWVYSGRRGIHGWVSDPSARKLGVSARSAVAEYLQVLSGGDGKTKKVNLRSAIHPSLERALAQVKKVFAEICLVDQNILGTKEKYEKVIALLPNDDLQQEIRKTFADTKDKDTSTERWNLMNSLIYKHVNSIKKSRVSERALDEIMFQYTYPRLDINVSKGLNHLLKSPFCVHPKTGRVCVPIDPSKVEQFDPEKVPTISQLTDEIDAFAKDEAGKVVSKDWKKTSLREPMKVFEEFLSKLSETTKGALIKASDAAMEF